MRTKIFACVFVLFAVSVFAAGPMTNADILKMLSAGLDKKNITAAIEGVPDTAFEVVPAGLLALKCGGVDDDIILKIQDAALKQPQGKPAFVMTNEKVIEMVKDKKCRLKDKIVLKAIQNAPSRSFDVSAQGLVDLKLATVSDAVITQIQELSMAKSAPAPKPEPLNTRATIPAPPQTVKQTAAVRPARVTEAIPAATPTEASSVVSDDWKRVRVLSQSPSNCKELGSDHKSYNIMFKSKSTKGMEEDFQKKAAEVGANTIYVRSEKTDTNHFFKPEKLEGDAVFFKCP